MQNDILFDKFLESLKKFDKPLIEAIQQAKTLIEAEQPRKFVEDEDYFIVSNDLGERGGEIIIDAKIPWDNFPEQKQKVIDLMKESDPEYDEDVQDSMLEESRISIATVVDGSMVSDGDHSGDWSYFEPETQNRTYMLITPVIEAEIKLGEGFDPIIQYASEAIDNAYDNKIEAIGEGSYEYRPGNRWAYGATH